MSKTPGDLAGWLDYISAQHSSEIELGLDRLRRVAEALKLKPFNCPVITVAGTNGKGSSVSALEKFYTAAGYLTGCYTSPHLTIFNERIRVGCNFASDDELCQAFAMINAARGDTSLTYFEFATLAALILFELSNPDIVLLEVGLGGRLDATNLFPADLALITCIGIDHADWLGHDRETIAVEKAGIIHPGKTVVIADPEAPASLLEIAYDRAQRVFLINQDFHYELEQADWSWQWNKKVLAELPLPGFSGRAQLNNIAGVLMCITVLQSRLPVSDEILYKTLPKLSLPGRFQVIQGKPLIVLDVAHNPDSTALLAENLREQTILGETYAVVAMLKDKDIMASLSHVSSEIDYWYVAGLPVPRGESADIIRKIAQKISPNKCIHTFLSVDEAWKQALKEARGKDRILVFGSFHTVGAIISLLSSNK